MAMMILLEGCADTVHPTPGLVRCTVPVMAITQQDQLQSRAVGRDRPPRRAAAARAARAIAARRRSAAGACPPGRGCPPHAGWRRSWAFRAAWSPRHTASSSPRATWRPARARRARRQGGARRRAPTRRRRSLLPKFPYHFHPGLPDLAGFPRDRWLRSLRAAWRESPLGAVGYGDPRGVPRLREVLADYLARVRGAAADPEHLLMCTGFHAGILDPVPLAARPGHRRDRRRGPRLACASSDRRAGRTADDPGPGRRSGPARPGPRRHRRHRGAS